MRLRRRQITLVAALLIILPLVVACRKEKDDAVAEDNAVADEAVAEEKTEKEKVGIEFPYELEDGKLIVNSLFQSSIENPDCENEIGEDIASLEIENQSEEFCTFAEIKVTMEDDIEISFTATNIPAGKKVLAFAVDNQSIDQESNCKTIESNAEFGTASMMEGQISWSVEDTTITIQNLTDSEITDLVVGYHCLFEDAYFGGLTYSHPLQSLAAGESIILEADECYMGTAEVVSIVKNH